MPNWSTEVPEPKKHMGFDLKRTPEAAALEGIITCETVVGCDTHYWGGRTLPCESPNCDACNNAMPYRWHAYVSAYCPRTHCHFLFECTANAAKAFKDYAKAHGTLRGCFFHAERTKRTKNAKVIIATRPANLTQLTLPTAPNVMLAMAVIWKLPTTAMRQEHDHEGTPTIKTNPLPLHKMRTQPNNAPDPSPIGEIVEQLTGTNGRKRPCKIA